jgi:hypothetical protein
MPRVLAIAVSLLVSGCGDKQLDHMESIKAELCACKTFACGDAAMKKMQELKVKSSRRAQRIAADMIDCMAKLNDQGRPSTDPDADVPSSPGSAAPASAETP